VFIVIYRTRKSGSSVFVGIYRSSSGSKSYIGTKSVLIVVYRNWS